ncbi:MAG: TetR family transcriptional regulator [Alphaproteobacteria bacterium]|nr:TetR family transcriptional regulator [Alphaproteobacteria bacterium]OUT39388.1 MAG: TetR family transcriptional regulator [Micavibrio sp. TMED2]MAS48758.1 TetR family transcriptional regulator [Alphaproteobacteria bacterium]MAX94377.1 TetR family transcriptional regulator [Alphaproteobacteria bacterium]MAX94444.1 TetR family transcriptional regulator [Alphaproteobacteria bacterium]|tara:strand:+ start:12828 stop:13286 length:459 start_codon:yes stop_codon:yes gene_type:complete
MFRIIGTALALTLIAPAAFAQSVVITHSEDRGGQIGSPEVFTGTSFVAPVFPPEMNDVSAGEVTFLPGARSAWHTHPAGQMLVVTHGTGWTQERGHDKQVIKAGDVVWCPPGVEHWHGATDSTSVTHYAMQGTVDGSAVEWGVHVTDEEYAN